MRNSRNIRQRQRFIFQRLKERVIGATNHREDEKMRKVPYLIAAAALSGLALSATPSSAGLLASGLASGTAAVPQLDEGLIQKVHGWHCRKRWSKRWGWHRHRRACYDDDYSYYPYYGYPGYGLGFTPFFGFTFFDDDDHHHRRHHRWRRHHNW